MFFSFKGISPYNNRVFKTVKNDKPQYEIRLASVNKKGKFNNE